MNYFWAKTSRDGKPGISVLEHMRNVGEVAVQLARMSPELLTRFHMGCESVGALAALHDLGKISPGFQRKCDEWLKENNLSETAHRWNWERETEPDHGKVTHAALQKFFNDRGMDEKTATYLSAVLGGHHGRLSRPNERGYNPQKAVSENQSGISWDDERKNAADAIASHFGISFSNMSMEDTPSALWWLAGLTSVADWIGSDERYFPVEGGLATETTAEVAGKCLDKIGLSKPTIVKGLSFYQLFDFHANSLQQEALSAIDRPAVDIIEAPMGMGKTEAALGAAYNLLCSEKATGIYFALPTQATSNRMHLRMNEFITHIAPDAVGSRVIHSNSWLLRDDDASLCPARTTGGKDDDAQTGRDWFSSAKRALIYPFGVGTIDQALLGIVAAKHFFVRHFALAGKVVILDEIHSYDLYTGTLIDKLIETLESLGCTVIILSATLSRARREQIIGVNFSHDSSKLKEPYPLITGRSNGNSMEPIAVEPPSPKNVGIRFETEDECVSLAVEGAANGACVVWVSNTVAAAQSIYRKIRELSESRFRVGLLHSHFPFWRREQLEKEWMDRLGKDSSTRCGSVLVSTQIVEQSVDLDADLMISELAPTDMLLQRMGRLWRHKRDDRPLSKPQFTIIEERASLEELRDMEENEILDVFGEKKLVYDPYVLLRSLEQWKKRKKIKIPTDIRKMIEDTYKGRPKEPPVWQALFEGIEGKNIALKQKALMSSNIWQVALNDDEGVQTRLNELRSLSLILTRSISKEGIVLIDGTSSALERDGFQLPTAKALHRNLVRIPEYHFGRVTAPDTIAKYVHGKFAVALVRDDGFISLEGLKNDVALRWDIDEGLITEKRKEAK
jgi:CRISPR-associated endonuclease/helicase Cas3